MSRKTIIITGGNGAIGKEIARKALEYDYSVHIIGRNLDTLRKTCEELNEYVGGDNTIEYTKLDLAVRAEIKEFCKNWSEPLYGLVNNAGICQVEGILDNTGEDVAQVWDSVMRTNLDAVFLLTKLLAPYLIAHEGFLCGRIVNIASQLGREGRTNFGAYCASKFGMIGLTKSWAKELGKYNVTVNAVCPGFVDTHLSRKDVEEQASIKGLKYEKFMSEICSDIEYRRFTSTDEVASLVIYLLSENASGISGRDWLMHSIWSN